MKLFLYLCIVFSELVTLPCKPPQLLFENSPCTNENNQTGLCTQLPNCPAARNLVNTRGTHNYQTCNFINLTEIVCCPMLTSLRLPNVTLARKSEKACENYTKDYSSIIFPTVYGGENALSGQFPFMAALGLYSENHKIYKFSCGGTIISESYVVTAAHCLLNPDEDKVKIVRLGVINVPESVTEVDPRADFKVKRFEIHPNYTHKYEINDIALVELEKPLEFTDNLRPACLFSNGSRYPHEFVIVGWGEMGENRTKSEVLQRATVYHVNLDECTQKYAKYKRPLFNTQVCASHISSDTCPGDSGGPLVLKQSDFPVLVGITSFGRPGCFGNRPSIYTSVSQYLDWIEEVVWKNST